MFYKVMKINWIILGRVLKLSAVVNKSNKGWR